MLYRERILSHSLWYAVILLYQLPEFVAAWSRGLDCHGIEQSDFTIPALCRLDHAELQFSGSAGMAAAASAAA
jgi:hypothetical protein